MAADESDAPEYWDERLREDWNARGGEPGRAAMGRLIGFLPAEIRDTVGAGELSVLDCGCATGEGTKVLAAEFPASQVAGFDSSREAIAEAQRRHPELDLFVARFLDLDREADMLVCAQGFEHLRQPFEALRRLLARSFRYVVLLVPFLEEDPPPAEHSRVVHPATFPHEVGEWRLRHCIPIPPVDDRPRCQALLIYERGGLRAVSAPELALAASQAAVYRAAAFPADRSEESLRDLGGALQRISAESEGEIRRLDGELKSQRREAERAQRAKMELEGDLQRARADLVRAEEDRAALGARGQELEQEARRSADELARWRNSRLWRVANYYWRARRWMRRHARVSIVVVTWNNLDLNRDCLDSLFTSTSSLDVEVVVVDNGSTDGTADFLRTIQAAHPGLRVVFNADNRGFAPAVNQALSMVTGEFVVLLNNDTVVPPGWLSFLLRHLEADPGIGMVGPVSNAIGNQARVEVGYTDIGAMPEWAARWMRDHHGETFEVPMLPMFCVAMRRQTLEQVGALDERFEKGMFEDDDFSRRVKRLGLRLVCARDSFVHHWQKASFSLLGESEYLRIFHRNRRRFEEKWGEEWTGEGTDLWRDAPDPDQEEAGAPAAPAETAAAPPGSEQAAAADLARRASEAKGVVVFLPSLAWGTALFQRPHQLARAFARRGYVVLFDVGEAGDDVQRIREIEHDLFLVRGGHADSLGAFKQVILWTLPYNYHQAADYPAGSQVVYDWIDDLAVFRFSAEFLRTNHDRALREAAVVTAVARTLLAEARDQRPDALYLPNGVEYEHFASDSVEPPDDPQVHRLAVEGKPVAGYYGALAKWLDYELVDAVARLRPDWNWLLVGPQYDGSLAGQPLLTRPNVVWTGPRPYPALPAYLRLFTVATIPFRINRITRSTSPLKLFEYLAGGKPVVSTPLPECVALPAVHIARNAEEFSSALDCARDQAADPGARAALQRLGEENSWVARVDAVIAHLAACQSGRPQRKARRRTR